MKEGGQVFEGRNACVCGPHPSPPQACSADVVFEVQFPFFPPNASFILHLYSATECQVFSRSASSKACHKISAGSYEQFKVQLEIFVSLRAGHGLTYRLKADT